MEIESVCSTSQNTFKTYAPCMHIGTMSQWFKNESMGFQI